MPERKRIEIGEGEEGRKHVFIELFSEEEKGGTKRSLFSLT